MNEEQHRDPNDRFEELVKHWSDNGTELSECNAIRQAFALGQDAKALELGQAIDIACIFLDTDNSKRYDDLAALFYLETRYMAPGKSVPVEMSYNQPDDATLWKGWADWIRKTMDKTRQELLDGSETGNDDHLRPMRNVDVVL